MPLGPEARCEQTESISLAFVTAFQVLPPRQLAVLILRDVLGFHANEVADMLDSSLESVNSALKRARTRLQRRRSPATDREPPPVSGSASEDAIVAKFVRAYESGDLDAVVALLTDDVFTSMPPMPFEYEGRDVVAGFCAGIFGSGRMFDLVPTRANGQPAFGAYLRASDGIAHGVGLIVLTPHRRADLRHDPLRECRAPMVRANAIAAEPVAMAVAGRITAHFTAIVAVGQGHLRHCVSDLLCQESCARCHAVSGVMRRGISGRVRRGGGRRRPTGRRRRDPAKG